ncbi:hypothetical protein, partial [Pseudomonas sp. CHM02]|uniref:hypothetical protein n=1 Tax=Pseudomonas sp. CHM02 TaxID=1463662 RepID=UPI001C462CFA
QMAGCQLLTQSAEAAGMGHALVLMAADRKGWLHTGLFDAVGGSPVKRAGDGAQAENHQVLSGFNAHGTDL